METKFGLEYPHFHGCAECIESSGYLATVIMNIDTKEHIYLIDHVFGNKCFVPATMIMEIFLEAALWYERSVEPRMKLFPSMLLNLNIERAIAIDPGGSLQVTVNIIDTNHIEGHCHQKIEITSDRVAKTGKIVGKRLNASCEVVLTPEDIEVDDVVLPDIDFDHYSVNPEKYYEYLFPSLLNCFHGSTGDVSISKDAKWLIGTYNCANKESDYIKGIKSDFVSSPLGNDTCLQYAVFLARYVANVGRLPVGGKKIVFSKFYPKNGDVKVKVNLIDINEDTAVLDIVSLDNENRPIFYAEKFTVRTSPFQSPLYRDELYEFFHENSTALTSEAGG